MELNLKEIFHPKMDILFVALKQPKNANNGRHYFSNNLSFWNLLFKSGLIVNPILNKLKGDEFVFKINRINLNNSVYSICDLVNDAIETNSNKVIVNQNRAHKILQILAKYEIKKLCLMHSKVINAFEKEGLIHLKEGYGQVGSYENTIIFKMPFHNASIENKVQYYKLLIN